MYSSTLSGSGSSSGRISHLISGKIWLWLDSKKTIWCIPNLDVEPIQLPKRTDYFLAKTMVMTIV